MKLTPEQQREVAANLRRRAELATIPEDKARLSNNAGIMESLALLQERRQPVLLSSRLKGNPLAMPPGVR